MLAGNSPVYSGISNDELLHLRLSEMPGYPIVLQDLKELSEVCVNFHLFEINANCIMPSQTHGTLLSI